MNKFLPPELKDLSDSKKRVIQNVTEKVEERSKRRKLKWPYTAMTAAMLASAMYFIFQVTVDKEDGKPASDTEVPLIKGEKPVDSVESPMDEEKPKDEREAALDLSKPTFTNNEGIFTVNGITVGAMQENVINQLGDSYSLEDDLDGSGADKVMNYDNQIIVYFYKDKVDSILFLDMDEEHAHQIYMDATEVKFMSGETRFIYSVETAQIIKMEYTPDGQLNVRFSQNDDPNFGSNPGFTLEQVGGNSYYIALNHSQPIVSFAKENLYLHGITLGDPEVKVTTYFGDAYTRNVKDDGETTLLYGDELEFTFRDGQLEFMSYLKADEKYFNQVLTDFEGVDLYSAETAQMISTEHSAAGDLIVTLHYSEQ